MAKFIGGPYDGMDLPFDPQSLRRVNLPEKKDLDAFLNVRDGTSLHSWPYLYEAREGEAEYHYINRKRPNI